MNDINDHSGRPHGYLPEDELFAAEYALGVLAGPERADVERRIARQPVFAASVTAWDERLSPWAAEIAEVEAPPRLWDHIAARLPAQSAPRSRLLQDVAFWRGLVLAACVLGAACVGALIYLGGGQNPLVAALDAGGQHIFIATLNPRRTTVVVVPASFTATGNNVPELWLILPGAKPRALGLIDANKLVALTIPANLRSRAISDGKLAVTLEPPGGSPTGQPTGPVIAAGTLTKL